MYKIVTNYIDELNDHVEDIVEKKGIDILDECEDEQVYIEVRDFALDLLEEIYNTVGWTQEFITAFAVYCNFFILNGLHMGLNNDFGLEDGFYKKNDSIDDDKKAYLEHIRRGIFEQDIEEFGKAEMMDMYNFDIPKLYMHRICFLEICACDEKDFKEDQQTILQYFDFMEYWESRIVGEVKELIKPCRYCVEEERKEKARYDKLLPEIVISDLIRGVAIAASEDLRMMSEIRGDDIKNFDDLLDEIDKMAQNIKEAQKLGLSTEKEIEKVFQYHARADMLIDRINHVRECDDESLEGISNIESRDDGILWRRRFLKLPIQISEKQYKNIELARQLALIRQKNDLIEKNARMVEDYSHSIENIIKPALITEVAEYLRENNADKKLYNRMMYIYFNEIITQNECRLLKMVHNVSNNKGLIRKSLKNAKKKSVENKITMEELVYKAFEQISLQLEEDSQKARYSFIMEKMDQAGIDSQTIEEKLWDSSRKVDAVYEMYRDKIDFRVEIDEKLDGIVLNKEEMGTSFLYTRIVEVLLNALTYADYGENRKFCLKIYLDDLQETNEYIVIEMLNRIGNRSYPGGGRGLQATATMLERINYTNENEEFVFVKAYEDEEGNFVTQFYIDADIYM